MSTEAVLPKIALAGNPNCGKTSLFNALTGGRQKVGNYPGVTVERKEGRVTSASGKTLLLLDLPGTYSLDARTPDEAVTRDVVLGKLKEEAAPDLVIAVADATCLERSLGLVIELRDLGIRCVLALNMMDLARTRGMELDLDALSRELGIPVIPTVATRKQGTRDLITEAEKCLNASDASKKPVQLWQKATPDQVRGRFAEVDRVLRSSLKRLPGPTLWTDRLDRVLLHPVWGFLVLAVVLAVVFQSIFNWASIPQDLIKDGLSWLGKAVEGMMAAGPLRSLLVDGVIAGVGSVLVFLPQILLLFLFILLLEDSGYMARAAFLMDRMMGRVGLHGRAFIPLLSSFACAIPGIMATRTIENPRDRLTTILVAPLMTCSARLPVYSLIIAAFIPNRTVWGPLKLQGLVMLGLYVAAVVIALAVALILKRTVLSGANPPLLMELPTYKVPSILGVFVGLVERAKLFLRRAGTVILTLMVMLWFLSSYPQAPAGATQPAIEYSYAGRLGHVIEPLLKPIGFNWRISIALIPGFAAREVMVGALATVYAVEQKEEGGTEALGAILAKDWSIATALSLLAWYVISMQCASTLAVTRRETNSWKWPVVMLVYMTALAYLASFLTYRIACGMGLG